MCLQWKRLFESLNLETCHFFGYVNSLRLILQLQDDIDQFLLQLDGAPPHWLANVQDYLDEHLLHRWTERVSDYNVHLPNGHPEVLP
ncbi:hypothetical protein TNCV_5026871 [Trichonephila clavipes]|uniref:Uncharacterized protein n=1 Tax=Trichonephila clavipes TaxID=2585209 RepID=A0A8X6RVM5_TRICX|nr:hypothetical protein TNCV_5026871 [Trichonephila clavipes]